MLDHRVHTFLTVCELMNFTRAAQRLHLTQPGVSQQIHFLEETYGARLFTYQNKRLTLTPAGAVLRDRLRSLENDERAISAELEALPNGAEELSIGVTMTIGEYAVVEPLARFLSAHPSMNLRLIFGNTQRLLRALAAGTIQLALVEGYYPKEQYAHLPFGREEFIGVCAAGHRFACGTPQTLSDLLPERLLVREKGSGTREILARSLALDGLGIEAFPHFLEVGNMHSLLSLLRRNCGVSFLYRIAAEEGLQDGSLQEIHLPGFPLRHDFDFLWEKTSIYSARYRALGEELSRCRQK